MKKTIFRAFALVLACIAVGVQLVSCSTVGSFSINDDVVCTVNGSDVTYDEYKYFFYSHLTDMKTLEPGTDFSTPEGIERLKELVEYSLAKKRVVLDLCEKYKIELTSDDDDTVDAFIEDQIDNTYGGSENSYIEALLDKRYTGDLFRADAEYVILEGRLYEFLKTGAHNVIDMTPQAIISDVLGGNFYRYKHIFFEMRTGVLSTVLEAEAQRCLYTIATQGFDVAGEDFSDEAYSKDGIYATIGEKIEIAEKTVLSLQINEVSDVVKSDLGYHIFKRLAIDEEYVQENYQNFEDSYATRKYNELVEAESKKAEFEYTEDFTGLNFEILTKREEID